MCIRDSRSTYPDVKYVSHSTICLQLTGTKEQKGRQKCKGKAKEIKTGEKMCIRDSLLIDQIKGDRTVRQVIIPTNLQIRESSRKK